MKKYANLAFVYAVLAMVGGVFYREFTKFNGFEGRTTLGFVHVHYMVLGVVFFLLFMLINKELKLDSKAKIKKLVISYQVGLNAMVIMLLVRGVAQTMLLELSKGASAAISGIAGISHIILGVSLLMILWEIKKSAKE